MDMKERASTFCPHAIGPAVLDKSSALSSVDKTHRSRLQIDRKSANGSRQFYLDSTERFSYLTKSGRFLILIQVSPLKRSSPKVVFVERCSVPPMKDIRPILEMNIDTYPYSMSVSPNEKFMVICGKPYGLVQTNETVILYSLNLSGKNPKIKKVDSLDIDFGFPFCLSLTDKEFIYYNFESSIKCDIGKKFSQGQLCKKSVLENGMLRGSLSISATPSTGLYVFLANSRTGKGRKKLVDKDWRGAIKNMRTNQIYPNHLQNKDSTFHVITSIGGEVMYNKVYIIQIEGNNLKVIKTIYLMDVAEDAFGLDFVDIGISDPSESEFGDISINPYTGDCYALFLHEFPIGDNNHPPRKLDGPLICRQRIIGFNIFSPANKHILEVSDLVSIGSHMLVNWSSNEVLVVDTKGMIVGYQIPVNNLSLQSLAKREVLKLYKPDEIIEFDIPRYLREYLLS